MIDRRTFLANTFSISSLLLMGHFPFNEQTMMQRKIPSSGEKLPVVGIGTWQTFDVGNRQAERAALKEVLRVFTEKGGKVIDSSPMYGSSEAVVGDLAQSLHIHPQLFLATKVWTTGKESGIQQMERSFQKFHSSHIQLMQVHNLQDWRTHLPTLYRMKEEGSIRYVGITHYHTGGYAEMERIMKNESLDFIQINYSISSREAAERLLPLAEEKGIAVLINRPYEGGSLFRRVKGKVLPTWAKEFGCESWGQFFLKFILSHPAVTCVIPGTSKMQHLLDNLGATKGNLPDKAMQQKMIQYLTK